ncbi:MAG: ATP-dependent Clp protease ATP-binding subunit [Chloroflexi bacterium]|nr:ATP-dependent Clp protease ATP-binding subunit [Chloroflexota bacterium]
MTPSPDIPEKELRERCASLLAAAAEEARRQGHNYIGVEHLFIAATRRENGPTANLLKRAGFSARQVRNEIRREIGQGDGRLEQVLPLTPRSEMVLALAIFLADRDEDAGDEIDEAHLLMAILQEGESIPIRKLIEMGFDLNLWLQRLLLEAQMPDRAPDSLPENPFSFPGAEEDFALDNYPNAGGFASDISHSDMRIPTPLLDKYGRDLTAQAAAGKIGPAIAREREIRALARTLARSKKNNPLLLGDAGVGKTAVVEGLAYAIHEGIAPRSLLNRRIVQIEIGTLVAGTSLRGQFEERLIGIVDEAKNAGNVIMFIDEIHTIVGAGDTIDSNLDAANILKPALARGELICIGATTHEEYRRAIAQDPALDRRFRTIDIEEPSQDDTLAILAAQRKKLEEHHGVSIRPQALEAAVRMSVRYLPDRRLPDKALDLIDEACTRVVIRTIAPDEDNTPISEVRVENIASVLSDWTGIPVTELTKDEKRRLAGLDEALSRRVIGQDAAVQTVAEAIKTARAGLGDPNRPVGVFLFLGPSGVGKTELARALADFLFGSDEAMLRLDMSEFHDSHTVARLIGAPPGYKDTQRGGQLSDGLRRRPYSVVLLDEVEKAAPEVFDIFLQVFDEGRLSDAHGRHVDARHAVFIMTSNIGTEETGKSLGFTQRDELPDYTAHLSRFFRPEFLNRVDEIITFRSLNRESMSRILDLQLGELHQRLNEQKLKLELAASARDLILNKGYDPVNGARPLRRAIERLLTRPLSARIVEDAFQPGDTIVAHATEDERLRFEAARP